MSYSEKVQGLRGILTAQKEDLTTVADLLTSYVTCSRVQLRRLALLITTAIVSPTSSCVVTVSKRPTVGSDTGRTTIATITIPTGVAAGKVYYKDVDDIVLDPGNELMFAVTTACAGAGAAGKAVSLFECYDQPETPANQSNMVASA